MKNIHALLTVVSTSCLTIGLSQIAQAQDQDSDEYTLEEIVVTGSYIKGQNQFNSPSPISVIGADDLGTIGASNIADLVQTLTINNGSQNNPDAFTQNATTGTSNFNLRGLGVASTLVLLNGKRQVSAATVTNDGVAFVDTASLTPQIAIQRIEILKDGAAAIYGTDAVAGVVNFITDDKFEGFAFDAKSKSVTDQGSSRDLLLEAKFGWGNDSTHLMVAGSYNDRTPLTTSERRLSRAQDDSSVLGNPGAFIGLGLGALPPGVPIVDPTGCEANGGATLALAAPVAGLQPGYCQFDFGDYYNLVPDEQRKQAIAVLSQKISETTNLRIEAGWAKNEATRNNSPSFPFLQLGSAVVPSYHPGNVFGETVLFLGRAIGNGGKASPNEFSQETYRFSAKLDGELDNGWAWETSVTHGASNHSLSTVDTVTANFQAALFGFGGDGCDPAGGPGVGACSFYNPFATSFGSMPNSQEMLDFVQGTQMIDGKSRSTVFDAVLSGTVGSTSAGDIGIAIGTQYRDVTFGRDYDALSNVDSFAFLIGNNDHENSQTVKAVFAEALIPLSDRLNLSTAVRFEDYGGNIGSTIDPKVSLIYQASEELVLRGTISTSFRAPSIYQTYGGGTALNQVADPVSGGNAFAAIRNVAVPAGGRTLDNETSKTINLGTTWAPKDGLEFSVDFWNYNFKNVIIGENFQAVVNSDPLDATRVIRAGGSIVMVMVDFVNASDVKTNGLDISAKYRIDTDYGSFTPFVEATRVMKYNVNDPLAGLVKGAGNRNFSNFGSPTPKLRGNLGLAFSNERFDWTGFVRHISKMTDDQNDGMTIGSMTTVDMQLSVNFSGAFDGGEDMAIQFGVINAFDKNPPQVFTNGGFESRTHDPRGRMAYVRFSGKF